MTTSRLLNDVCYLSRSPSKTTDIVGTSITVQDTFPYNPESKTAPSTARQWANNNIWDSVKCEYVKGVEPTFLERPNEPFAVTIIDLDVRTEGGRAYKVIDNEMRCFDLREDQILEVFKHVGVQPGGRVNGEFVWGVLGSQVRMVLVGGDLYSEMVKTRDELNAAKKKRVEGNAITPSKLQVGHVYKKLDGSKWVFVGKMLCVLNEKPLYALVELPEDEPYYQHCKDYVYEEKHAAWEKMSWEEKLVAEHEARTYEGDIKLLTSPKFLSEEDVALDVAFIKREFHQSTSMRSYKLGNGDDASLKLYELEHGGDEFQFIEHPCRSMYRSERDRYNNIMSWWSLSEELRKQEEDEYKTKYNEQVAQLNHAFAEHITWL